MTPDQVIVALDVPDLPKAIALVDRLPGVGFWKVGLELFVGAGPVILAELKDRGKRIFLDLKFHDIPNTMLGACLSASRYEVDLLTLHATAGSQALTLAAQAMAPLPHPPKLLAITLLTSIGDRQLREELQQPLAVDDYVNAMARLARNAGIDGAVCSPQEVAKLRQTCGPEFLLVTPGVRPLWSAPGDQQRVMIPAQAIAAGANYVVIGRPITADPSPEAAWERLCQDLAV
ncbi:orotidine 5' monophosphate decarboxylase [Synechocystis sp. PCC 6803]|uniref:Orotidine 5'-phosphate decarboxylase n=1 Tax=Synechocystis sp. (strain ATCC 27184 / PCC 6803 / Kazusa) TaxID=1111708 RepID=PYRF_SYNY3|nr:MULTISPECIES: orotidine-5'-phosphate decarboxylase [unclassified Synechocystis]P73761.1 RecName: Full=Orotidine 5'-phosphate decarboxylase; AltName: Full=OMP decarboxylase; Short=OMPDCase; Short=OMPdecase [Synechocystis sp. PCC 6803 substr. Kazusa]BAM51565.1 orotidine 5'-phosphate decarboxylase [Synechocystis sp. PCC 6803] [Bacillus subtilis BEST7613]AGF51501.1 orotidine 5' monophosphate decarboxylase [Synechocystis sp. PCC 6803]ALJ67502.1 orotidine 5'-phosphate decarboxylase [Synechocystis 